MKPQNKYWKLSTKEPEFTNSLIKIGIPEDELPNWDFFDGIEDVFVFKIFNVEKEKYEFSVSHFDSIIGAEFCKI